MHSSRAKEMSLRMLGTVDSSRDKNVLAGMYSGNSAGGTTHASSRKRMFMSRTDCQTKVFAGPYIVWVIRIRITCANARTSMVPEKIVVIPPRTAQLYRR